MTAREGIKNVIVLMLENRSFDSILGTLNKLNPAIDGVTDECENVYAEAPVRAWSSKTLDGDAPCIPTVDPGESFTNMHEQIFGKCPAQKPPVADMSGFVSNYAMLDRKPNKNSDIIDRIEYVFKKQKPIVPCEVMHHFTSDQLPVLNRLAMEFGVCDRWFASAPCQTWPNRFFAHTGTCQGKLNNADFSIPFKANSIFKLLNKYDKTWRVYFHDLPQSILIEDVWSSAPLHYRFFNQFLIDAENGALPNYSFIEPRYFPNVLANKTPNDQHPPHNVLHGEELIAAVYNAVRQSPCWKNSLLIITYDEHGGCYDHVPPPSAVPPDSYTTPEFGFDRYGVRVPCVIVSPYIKAGSIVRNDVPTAAAQGTIYPYDHTSIIATLCDIFNIDESLTDRDKFAPSVLNALNLSGPSNDGLDQVTANPVKESSSKVMELVYSGINQMQESLCDLMAKLPTKPLYASENGGSLDLERPAPETTNLSAAATYAVERVRSFLGI